MRKIFCFGEFLLRLSPQLGGIWINETSMPVYLGGAELNVATALAGWGLPVAYGTALPDNNLSHEIIAALNQKKINTGAIHFSGNRIGCYYLPQGADLKNAGVIYDRAYSSFSELQPGDIDWDKVLDGVDLFHFSAISPALNAHVAAVCLEAVEAASAKGIVISVDLNYRARLWQYGKAPADVMPQLIRHCSIVMGNIWAAEKMLNIPIGQLPFTPDDQPAYYRLAQHSSIELMRQYPQCRQVGYTFRFDAADGVRYFSTLAAAETFVHSGTRQAVQVVDKVGSGDCFMAGLIYGHFKKLSLQETVDFAAAAAFDKFFRKGDSTTATVADIQKVLKNG